MSAKHTPGPWFIESHFGEHQIYAKQGPLKVRPATVYSEPDARLISAAPELLEALIGCQALIKTNITLFVKHDDPKESKSAFLQFAGSVDTAIAKATGAVP